MFTVIDLHSESLSTRERGLKFYLNLRKSRYYSNTQMQLCLYVLRDHITILFKDKD